MHEHIDTTGPSPDQSSRWTCRNCGHHIMPQYGKVFAPPELEAEKEVRTCPRCTKVRTGDGGVRQARSRGASYQEGEVGDGDD